MNVTIRLTFFSIALFSMLSSVAFAESSRFVFGMHKSAKPVPEIEFNDADGMPRTLSDFEGKYVLLNVWATWCPPCRKELPDLQRLQEQLGGDQFHVIALSTDAGRLSSVQQLYEELDLSTNEIFIDEAGSAMRSLGIFAMPTTLLIDPQGQEIGRKPGPADWDSDAAVAFFSEQMITKQ